MKHRAFGRTGIQVAEVVFGAGVITTYERHGRESILTANTSLLEEERTTRAVFDAIGAGEGTRAQVALRFVLSKSNRRGARGCGDEAAAGGNARAGGGAIRE